MMDKIEKICFGIAFAGTCTLLLLSLIHKEDYKCHNNCKKNCEKCFKFACQREHIDRIKLIIKTSDGNILYWYVYHACKYGLIDILRLIIELRYEDLIVNNNAFDWNLGLEYACYGGYINIVLFMIQKGANSWNRGLVKACQGGHMDIILLMIERGAIALDWGLSQACLSGHMDIVKLMIEKGANDWNGGLWGACRSGHMDIALVMIEKGSINYEVVNWDRCLYAACIGGHMNIVQLMIEKIGLLRSPIASNRTRTESDEVLKPKDSNINWNEGLSYACIHEHMNIAHYFIKQGAEPETMSLNIKKQYARYITEFEEISGLVNKLGISDCSCIVSNYLNGF